jgi:hypothetical protein
MEHGDNGYPDLNQSHVRSEDDGLKKYAGHIAALDAVMREEIPYRGDRALSYTLQRLKATDILKDARLTTAKSKQAFYEC